MLGVLFFVLMVWVLLVTVTLNLYFVSKVVGTIRHILGAWGGDLPVVSSLTAFLEGNLGHLFPFSWLRGAFLPPDGYYCLHLPSGGLGVGAQRTGVDGVLEQSMMVAVPTWVRNTMVHFAGHLVMISLLTVPDPDT